MHPSLGQGWNPNNNLGALVAEIVQTLTGTRPATGFFTNPKPPANPHFVPFEVAIDSAKLTQFIGAMPAVVDKRKSLSALKEANLEKARQTLALKEEAFRLSAEIAALKNSKIAEETSEASKNYEASKTLLRAKASELEAISRSLLDGADLLGAKKEFFANRVEFHKAKALLQRIDYQETV
jgi:hypothetical protein